MLLAAPLLFFTATLAAPGAKPHDTLAAADAKAAAALTPPGTLRTPTIFFQGRNHRVDKLPEEVRPSVAETIGVWTSFAEEEDFSLALSDDQGILFLSEDKAQMKNCLLYTSDAADE